MARNTNTDPTPSDATASDAEPTETPQREYRSPTAVEGPLGTKPAVMNEAGEVGYGEPPPIGALVGEMHAFDPSKSTPAERYNPDRHELSPGQLHDANFNVSIDQGRPEDTSHMRNARRVPDPRDRSDLQDFPTQSTGDGVYVTNEAGAVHTVPGDWVTEDVVAGQVNGVRVRGNAGFRYANDDEIQAYKDEFDPKEEGAEVQVKHVQA
jgi:hypothetical protein